MLEYFPIIVALHLWGSYLRNKKILLHTDNMAVVQAINSMTSKSDNMMVLLRHFTLKCLEFNVLVKTEHIPGYKNSIADSLSRFQFQRFRELAPQAEKSPDQMPQHFQLTAKKLVNASLSCNTKIAYNTAIKTFEKFRSESGLTHFWPVTVSQIVQFLACYHDIGYAPSTMASCCSGLSFMHKINGFPDLTEDFVIGKMLEGCRRLDKRIDSRFPIRKQILQQLCLVLPKICFNNYEFKLFTTAYTLAYYGMLRAKECVYTSASSADRPLQFSDILIEGKQVWI